MSMFISFVSLSKTMYADISTSLVKWFEVLKQDHSLFADHPFSLETNGNLIAFPLKVIWFVIAFHAYSISYQEPNEKITLIEVMLPKMLLDC